MKRSSPEVAFTRTYDSSPSSFSKQSQESPPAHPTVSSSSPPVSPGANVYTTRSSANGSTNVGHAIPAWIELRTAVHSGGVLPVIADVSTMRRPTTASAFTRAMPLAIRRSSSAARGGERVDQGERDDERDEDDRPDRPPTDEHHERDTDTSGDVAHLEFLFVQHEEERDQEHDDHGESDDPSGLLGRRT